jgi:hypothetical protein
LLTFFQEELLDIDRESVATSVEPQERWQRRRSLY